MKSEQRKKEDRELIERFYDLLYNNGLCISQVKGFIQDENLEAKPKLEFNRWIVDSDYPDWLYFYGKGVQYGVNEDGEWSSTHVEGIKPLSRITERYATDEEILEGISKIAIKKGYKEGVKIEGYTCKTTSDFFWNNDILYLGGIPIFRRGKWADFIETDSEKIERLEKRVEVLEKRVEVLENNNK